MRTERIEKPPPWLSRITYVSAAVTLLGTLTALFLLARGAANPPTAGPVRWSVESPPWPLGSPADDGQWLAAPVEALLPTGAFTLSMRAVLTGDGGAAWGVWLGVDDDSRVLYALSDEGYITTRNCLTGNFPRYAIEICPTLRPEWRWREYPRVNPSGQANTITLHQEPSGLIRFRLNGEILGAAAVSRDGTWGIWLRGGRTTPAMIRWERAELRTPG